MTDGLCEAPKTLRGKAHAVPGERRRIEPHSANPIKAQDAPVTRSSSSNCAPKARACMRPFARQRLLEKATVQSGLARTRASSLPIFWLRSNTR